VLLHLKSFLGGWRFHDDSKVKEVVSTWFASPCYKCLNDGGSYVEKQRKVYTSNGLEINYFFSIAHQNLLSG
jgi:hypothetical protein